MESAMEKPFPKVILLFSGKRKSGKDTITDILHERIQDVAVNIKISAPIKSHFAKSRGLDYEQLMGNGTYKEEFRLEMIKWSETMRAQDYGYFCRTAVQMIQESAAEKPVWIVSDIRRTTDLQWFRENYENITTVRVCSTDEERKKRGWIFTPGIDDEETECGLDFVEDWDFVINNNGSLGDLEPYLDDILSVISLKYMKFIELRSPPQSDFANEVFLSQ